MPDAFPLYLEEAPVKLYRGSIRLPLVAGILRVRHNWITDHVFGNPHDWTQKLWSGGDLTLSGLVFAASNFNLLEGLTWESVKIGKSLASPDVICTIYGLHRQQTAIRMERVGDYGYIASTLSFRFDAYTTP